MVKAGWLRTSLGTGNVPAGVPANVAFGGGTTTLRQTLYFASAPLDARVVVLAATVAAHVGVVFARIICGDESRSVSVSQN